MQQLKFAGMDGIDEVTISLIHVKVGQYVKKGENVFDIEADKASDTVVSPYDGKVSKINFKSGDAIKPEILSLNLMVIVFKINHQQVKKNQLTLLN